jgi:acetylornithine/succinyldiaminopimelate/putrescine aminotransferase
VFVASGSEANDLAIRSVRWATGRRKIVCLEAGYHGDSGLSGAAGKAESARFFGSAYPDEFVGVPFDDLDAMEKALSGCDVAAVLMETIPATYGFPMPSEGYLPGVKALCEQAGSLYVADEVQTGLGRTGRLWGVECFGVEPDILITGKGLSGGMYPVSAVVLTRRAGGWLEEKGWAHVSTFGGAEIGCHVASRVLDLCSDPEALRNASRISEHLARGLDDIRERRSFLTGVRRCGLVMGLETAEPMGAVKLSQALYRHGVWAIFAGFDLSVLQWKPGMLIDEAYCDEVLDRLDAALAELSA